MAQSFGTDPVGLNIGVTIYMLTLAIFIPVSGWMADRLGARRVFAGAITIFTGASVLLPVGRLVMLRATEKRDLVRLIAYVAMSGLVAPVLGPPVGGSITTYLGWCWILFLNVPLGLIGIRFALALIGDDRAPSVPSFDLPGLSALWRRLYFLDLRSRTAGPGAVIVLRRCSGGRST